MFVDQKLHSWKTRANKTSSVAGGEIALDLTKIDKTRDVLNKSECCLTLRNKSHQMPVEATINSQNKDSVEGLDERAQAITLGIIFN